MTCTVTLKLTETERGTLDWLLATGAYTSRSDVLRQSMLGAAVRRGLQRGDQEALIAERQSCRPRVTRAALAARVRRGSPPDLTPTH